MPALRDVLIYKNPELLAQAAAERFAQCAQEAIQKHGRFTVALSGGNTPKRIYELLATDPFRVRIEWSGVHIFFGDERCVPPEHPKSNYRMVAEILISRVPVPASNVHRIIGEGDPAGSAKDYERELKSFFAGATWPRFDLVLLGMGEDGHVASLFPETAALDERNAWVMANWIERLGGFRITLTAPAINGAAHIIFLVAGAGKAARLSEVLNGPFDPSRLPAQLIKPTDGSLVWMVDAEAASQLSNE